MEQSEKISPPHNLALDVFRTLGLMMMVSINLVRPFLGDLPGTWEYMVRFVMESAPAFFLVAVGMTMLHTASTHRKWQRILELGIVAFLHQAYLAQIHPFRFDFLMLLWLTLFLAAILRPLFASRWFRIPLLLGIFFANLLIMPGEFGIWSAGSFGPMPWAFFVIIGMSIGLNFQEKANRRDLEAVGILLVLITIIARHWGDALGLGVKSIAITKWHPTTSIYVLMWTGIVLFVYGVLNLFEISKDSPVGRFGKIVSSNLLAGVVIHYFTNYLVSKLLQQAGYSADVTLPLHLLIVVVGFVCFADYIAIIVMINIRKLLTSFIMSSKRLYQFGWIIAVASLIAAIYLSMNSIVPHTQIAISYFGMVFAAFAFIRQG